MAQMTLGDDKQPNRIIYRRDNLEVLRRLDTASVDLIYADPPFGTEEGYAGFVEIGGHEQKRKGAKKNLSVVEFDDMWELSDDEKLWLDEMQADDPRLYHVIATAEIAHSNAMAGYLAYMCQRFQECYRVLKNTGSLYLHCDDHANYYLRILLDIIFGKGGYRNEISWKRQTSNNSVKKQCGRIVDTIFFYVKSRKAIWNGGYHKLSEAALKEYRHVDSNGRRYRCDNLTAPMGASRDKPKMWRGAIPAQGRRWSHSLERREKLWDEGRIRTKRDGKTPSISGYIRYLDENPGQKLQSLWTDVQRIGATAEERTGWPTQKPLALLKRIIKASSNEGDLVLDPFCGCATTCLAAEELGRRWIGIDVNPKVKEIVEMRFKKELNMFGMNIQTPKELPKRSDLPEPHFSKGIREKLFKKQGGACNGCHRKLDEELKDLFELDHIIPRSKGGENRDDNAQLLCATCNRIKSDKTDDYLKSRLRQLGRL